MSNNSNEKTCGLIDVQNNKVNEKQIGYTTNKNTESQAPDLQQA